MANSFNTKKINENFFTLFGSKSSADIAALVGVGVSAVYSWRKGAKQVPWDKLAMAKALSGKSWDWLLGEVEGDVAVIPIETPVKTAKAKKKRDAPQGENVIAEEIGRTIRMSLDSIQMLQKLVDRLQSGKLEAEALEGLRDFRERLEDAIKPIERASVQDKNHREA